ncbi:hypothetical protein EDD18DRAFT_1363945 [Armillaria luteobubalina]|uniref:Uncharacterized protein n=1 Tax=Armillaria luteobubalina TaxID=153913 RepID=A0AA39TCG7_9AGAR|nr:hypothetical protein EDD18DRAFT_1363945 [Armillaria luteobubalina]
MPPHHLYNGMLKRVLGLMCADQMRLSQHSHFLELAACDEWLDISPQKHTLPKADEDNHDNVSDDDDDQPNDDEKESEVVTNHQRMSIWCASVAKDRLSMLCSHALGLLISPRKAQILYYNWSAIIISEAFDILDSDDQSMDTLTAMLLGFSVIPLNSASHIYGEARAETALPISSSRSTSTSSPSINSSSSLSPPLSLSLSSEGL